MKLELYAVHDKAVNAFMQPFFCRARGEAFRSFIAACNDEKGPFVNHLPDYNLYYIGEFDDQSGILYPLSAPDRLLSAAEARDRGSPQLVSGAT